MGLPRIALAIVFAVVAGLPPHPARAAEATKVFAFEPQALAKIDRAVNRAIKAGKLPGGVLWLERKGAVYQKAYGQRATTPKAEPMTADTIFDCASLTKVCATTPCVLRLLEEGKLTLDDPVRKHLPEFTGDPNKSAVTIRHLLTHSSGLPAGILRGYAWSGAENGIALATSETSFGTAGKTYRYSDLNFILLGEIVGRLTRKPLDQFAAEQVFKPLAMNDTSFAPPAKLQPRIAPTARLADRSILRGRVHDPTARAMGGATGHAGLFPLLPISLATPGPS